MLVRWRGGLVATLFFVVAQVQGAGLQVAPVSLTIASSQNAEGLWLRNTGAAPLHAQVRVFRWTQEGAAEQLTPTQELLVSPPMLELAPEGRQFIRAIRAQQPPSGPGAVQQAYRLWIDELPLPDAKGKGLQFVMRHSVPVFVQPAGAEPGPPQLSWKLEREGAQAYLRVHNGGASHAQLADLVGRGPTGQEIDIHKGLLGYVLPGAQMRWPLKVPADDVAAGTWRAMVNGKTVESSVAAGATP